MCSSSGPGLGASSRDWTERSNRRKMKSWTTPPSAMRIQIPQSNDSNYSQEINTLKDTSFVILNGDAIRRKSRQSKSEQAQQTRHGHAWVNPLFEYIDTVPCVTCTTAIATVIYFKLLSLPISDTLSAIFDIVLVRCDKRQQKDRSCVHYLPTT
ncbi:hypothetical protein CSKR_113078 [Clonorchis sinensis]|uniref:Uncharacterized protein n=1 Tax=Clonorchis sinensis TaxID=79923 RepID=A0A3R7D7N0_CLOSI|nr:hypothetical protein CSKR_113078 [Clonorchis sinensis]